MKSGGEREKAKGRIINQIHYKFMPKAKIKFRLILKDSETNNAVSVDISDDLKNNKASIEILQMSAELLLLNLSRLRDNETHKENNEEESKSKKRRKAQVGED